MKYCYTCNTNYTDDAQYCPKCKGALTFIQNTDMNNQQAYMKTPIYQGDNPQYTISNANNSPQPQKKKNKKLFIGIVSVLLVLIIAVAAVVLIKLNEKPEEDFYAENLPKRILKYELNGEEYTSELVELRVISQEKDDGVVEADCEIVVEDDLFTRTLYYTIYSEKDDGEWEIEKTNKNGEDIIKPKEEFAELAIEGYEIHNISNYKDLSAENNDVYSFSYDVEDSYNMVDISGTIYFDVTINSNNSKKSDYSYDVDVDESELVADWDLAGSYVDSWGMEEIYFGIALSVDGEKIKADLYTKQYGPTTCETTRDKQEIFDKNGEINYVLDFHGLNEANVAIDYHVYFADWGISNAVVEASDGSYYDYNLVLGEFNLQMVEQQDEPQDPLFTDAGITIPDPDGECIYIYSDNSELGDVIDREFREKYPELSDLVIFKSFYNDNDEYIQYINDEMNGYEKPSIVAFDIDYIDNLLSDDRFVSMDSIGITDEMYSHSYEYNKQLATYNGKLMGLSYQACPGCFVYDPEIAESVFGTSDPDSVNSLVCDWDAFLNAAEVLKQNGYYILPSLADLTIGNGEEVPQYVIDAVVENGYVGDYSQWYPEWTEYPDDVFGYFGCTWFVDWCLNKDVVSKVCQGPRAFYWGGSFLGVTNECPNPELAALVLYTICCDESVMINQYEELASFPNNTEVVESIINEDYGYWPHLGGQNPLSVYHESALSIE